MIRFSLIICLICFLSCEDATVTYGPYSHFQGKTMGTYYAISYQESNGLDFKAELDSLLEVINDEVSTYIPTSTISRFNQSETGLDIGVDYPATALSDHEKAVNPHPKNWHFAQNYALSQVIREVVGGSFDPTVMPLVNYWGFGYTPKREVTSVDSFLIDSLLNFVGFDLVNYEGTEVTKTSPGVQLDFSAVAKGYAVDELGRFLETKGVINYKVEIGGEVRARGESKRGDLWRIGISTPKAGAAIDDFQLIVRLDDQSLATSGNYRNFYEVDGRKYAHTINPFGGYPELNNLLSASVFAKDCAIADGLATGFMVMGFEEAREQVQQMEGVEACFIYGKEDGSLGVYYTPGLESVIDEVE